MDFKIVFYSKFYKIFMRIVTTKNLRKIGDLLYIIKKLGLLFHQENILIFSLI